MVLVAGLVALFFADFTKLKVGPSGVEAERAARAEEVTAELNSAVTSAVQTIASGPSLVADRDSGRIIETEGVVRVNESAPSAAEERDRRRATESLIRESAEWGWQMAQIGFRRPPVPQIEWTAEGAPIIKYGIGSGAQAKYNLSSDRTIHVRFASRDKRWYATAPDGYVHEISDGWADVVRLREQYNAVDAFSTDDYYLFREQFGEPPA
jgi:hypothetical protein